jgi:dolichol-phosphate mannosyltransferase
MNATVVVIPTYNEAANIQGILRAVVDLPAAFDVLVVDDNSPDGTADLVRELMATFPQLHLEVRQNKDGLGPAYIHAFKVGDG